MNCPIMRQAIHNIMNTAPAFWQFCCLGAGAAGSACHLSVWLLLLIAVALQLCCWLGGSSLRRHCLAFLLLCAGYGWASLFGARPWQTYLNKMPSTRRIRAALSAHQQSLATATGIAGTKAAEGKSGRLKYGHAHTTQMAPGRRPPAKSWLQSKRTLARGNAEN